MPAWTLGGMHPILSHALQQALAAERPPAAPQSAGRPGRRALSV
jgi:hypothetical protein